MRNYYDDDARKQIEAGRNAATALHNSQPSDDTTQVLLTLGYMLGLIVAMDDELQRWRAPRNV